MCGLTRINNDFPPALKCNLFLFDPVFTISKFQIIRGVSLPKALNRNALTIKPFIHILARSD